MTDATKLADEIEALAAKATPGPWGIWFEQINGMADKAIAELIEQVHNTDPIGNSLVMLDADGKCPAITGCGPSSANNAALIVALRNNLPTVLAALRERDALAVEVERLKQRPWCETCGKTVPEVLCQTCAKWWADNDPQLAAYKAMAEEMAVALGDCATDLEAELEAQTPIDLRNTYPSISRKFNRDMGAVEAARNLLTRHQAMKEKIDG